MRQERGRTAELPLTAGGFQKKPHTDFVDTQVFGLDFDQFYTFSGLHF